MSTSRKVVIALAVLVLLFIAAMCTPIGGGSASASEIDDYTVVTPTQTFTIQGEQFKTRSGAFCWRWTPAWYAKNLAGIRLYTFGLDVKWCSGAQQQKVTDLVYNFCYDIGQGGATYVGCSKDKGSLGYASLGMQTYWTYKMWLPVVGDLKYYHPHVRFDLGANGYITGTVWYS